MEKEVLIRVDHSILSPGEIGCLTCVPKVSDEEVERLEQEWKREIRDIGLYAYWTSKKKMAKVAKKVKAFWEKCGFQIKWKHYISTFPELTDGEQPYYEDEEFVRKLREELTRIEEWWRRIVRGERC